MMFAEGIVLTGKDESQNWSGGWAWEYETLQTHWHQLDREKRKGSGDLRGPGSGDDAVSWEKELSGAAKYLGCGQPSYRL